MYYIGIDIGGTNIVCGIVDENGGVIAKRKFATYAHQGPSYVIGSIVEQINELLSQSEISRNQLAGVGCGIPGFVDPIMGRVIFNANLGWKDLGFATALSSQLHVPVHIDNDVRMYVYGEAVAGAGKGYHHVLGLTIGTGIAAASVHDGRLYYGRNFMAGEIGHVPIDGNTERCPCGLVGCLETLASARGMARQAVAQIRKGRQSILQSWFDVNDLEQITSADLTKACEVGDAVAMDVFTQTGFLLGKAIAHSIALLSPDVLIIGGGGALAGKWLFDPLIKTLEQTVYPGNLENLPILQAENIDDAGVTGSALHAKAVINQRI